MEINHKLFSWKSILWQIKLIKNERINQSCQGTIKMESTSFHKSFQKLIATILRKFDFIVEDEFNIKSGQPIYQSDLILKRNQQEIIAELKFYRSKNVGFGAIENALRQLKSLIIKSKSQVGGLLVVSAYVSKNLKYNIQETQHIQVWDRSDLYHLIKNELGDDSLLEEFERLLVEAKQGIDTEDVFADIQIINKVPGDYFRLFAPINFKSQPPSPPLKGTLLYGELVNIESGKVGWSAYEKKGIEILKYLFEKDLSKWSEQNATDDEINRFDVICRIASENEFWKCIVNYYRSLYVLFEFKNYSEPISQDQIFTTERYLYLRGLRSVGFIIAKRGGSKKAIAAAKGALRENGKLLMILDNNDLKIMLDMKDDGLSPSDHLSDKLDDFLITLSR